MAWSLSLGYRNANEAKQHVEMKKRDICYQCKGHEREWLCTRAGILHQHHAGCRMIRTGSDEILVRLFMPTRTEGCLLLVENGMEKLLVIIDHPLHLQSRVICRSPQSAFYLKRTSLSTKLVHLSAASRLPLPPLPSSVPVQTRQSLSTSSPEYWDSGPFSSSFSLYPPPTYFLQSFWRNPGIFFS
ncbi:hypothetical protein K435DRAFT_967555 [Dendrothele bispora CBS 962.96]|uniref:Uncharacterized protein n=1 Tax=Dendrothele bispora (strain CBS 962.96) TaxID=1314807 RepID=A0A4S8LTX1_DENBC|nr:hypothetical protein K435DRAFT_967555 [Dendrothele bispora CBS 962.96]